VVESRGGSFEVGVILGIGAREVIPIPEHTYREVQKRRYFGLLDRPAEMYVMVRVMAKLDNMMFNISINGKRKRYFM
jgi:hypothetical protein